MFASREPKLEAWDRIWTSCDSRLGQADRARLPPLCSEKPPATESLIPEKEPLSAPALWSLSKQGSGMAQADIGAGGQEKVGDSFLDPGEEDEFFDAREETTWQAREAQDAMDKAEVEGEESDSDAEVRPRKARRIWCGWGLRDVPKIVGALCLKVELGWNLHSVRRGIFSCNCFFVVRFALEYVDP